MAFILKELDEKRQKLIEEYYFQVRQTEKYWDRDYDAALRIQKMFKMFLARRLFKRKKQCAICVQKNFRGHIARLHFKNLKLKKINHYNVEYFSNQAKVIQRFFKGFYKRKYEHDFYARKNYLKIIKKTNEEFQVELNRNAERERLDDEKRREAIARTEFTELAKNLHHLSSTLAIPGVYNPPYSTTKPTAFDVDIETHLKTTFKANYTWKPPDKLSINGFKKRLAPIK